MKVNFIELSMFATIIDDDAGRRIIYCIDSGDEGSPCVLKQRISLAIGKICVSTFEPHAGIGYRIVITEDPNEIAL